MNTRKFEKLIVKALLDKKTEYPPELLAAQRAGFIAQIAKLNSRPLLQQGTAGSRQNEEARKAY